MGICNLSSILFLIILISTTPFDPFTLASSETNLNKNPNLKTISKANDDGESSGIEHVWCVAKNNAEDVNLQAAIDWACGNGGVDCGPIEQNKACYDPTNIQSTASYVFNDYYRKNGQTDESCNFSGVAALSSLDPSYGECKMQFRYVLFY
ncbi:hypothetical protein AQUCO_00500103v1 [Aquilegia coerulea]|uniref:X8 domain-containing protein n=1 Tax=Aquilegia coerulea TaxID=218851 RepID=A0A2G5EQC5_AQUCA|nr:hypothetical protein AQUCO_00500103v1 [Aquilegia coerulea]